MQAGIGLLSISMADNIPAKKRRGRPRKNPIDAGVDSPRPTTPVPPVPPVPQVAASPPGPVISGKSKGVQIVLQKSDCIPAMRSLAPGSIDLVVTSPPYNLGIAYNSYKDTLSDQAYLDWSMQWMAEVNRVLKPDGALFLNVGASPKDPLMPHRLILRATELFVLQNTFHWIKSITVETIEKEIISAGHFKPINSQRYVNDCHEFVYHLTKKGDLPVDRRAVGVPYVHKSNINRWGHTDGEDKRCRGNAWFVPYKTIVSRDKERPHPATFPVQLAENCILIHGKKSQTVMMDPFVGIGHAAVAAVQCKVKKFIGYDIDDDYLTQARHTLGLVEDV